MPYQQWVQDPFDKGRISLLGAWLEQSSMGNIWTPLSPIFAREWMGNVWHLLTTLSLHVLQFVPQSQKEP